MSQFWDDVAAWWGVISIPIVILLSVGLWIHASDARTLQREAIHYNYGSYAKNGNFVWRVEVEQETFLKDLEFFKRNEKTFRPLGPSSDIVPLPKTEDLFN